jgi:hypothetical protein
MMSFLERLRQEQTKIISPNDPWQICLERVRGRVGDDGIERISTQALLEPLPTAARPVTPKNGCISDAPLAC